MKTRRTVNCILVFFIAITMIIALVPVNADAASKIKLSKCTISLSYTSDVYTGNKKKPRVTVKYKGKKLKRGTDYSVTYKNNLNPGTAKVIVKGKGKYTGTVTKTCKIYVKPVASLTAKVTSGDAIQLKWSKPTGSKKYKIVVTADGETYKQGTYTTTSTAYKFTEVPSGRTYTFKVMSLAGPKNTASAAKTVSVTLEAIGDLAAPKITGKSPGYRRCDLSWNAVSNASGYSVEEVNSSGTKTTKECTENYISFYDKSKGSTYQYKVRAFTVVDGEKVFGQYSNTVSVKAAGTYVGQAAKNYDGKAGDSSGREVATANWSYSSSHQYNNWTYVFRFKDPAKAEKAARMLELAIANNKIGYCSNGTSTYGSNAIQYQAEAVGWDLSKVSKPTGCSCGDLVTLCIKYTGINCKYTGSGLAVAKELKRLSGDFTCYSDSSYTKSDAYLQRGDVLVTAHSDGKGNHVCMVL
ncbi:MAG: hypothetical protein ACSW8G_00160 [Bacillota bacterium]